MIRRGDSGESMDTHPLLEEVLRPSLRVHGCVKETAYSSVHAR